MDFVNHLLGAMEGYRSSGWLTILYVLLGLWLLSWVLGKLLSRNGGPESKAKEITDMQKAVYSGPHEYAPVRVSDFPWVDAAYYDEMQGRLEAVGFRCFGDVEDLTLAGVHPNMRTPMRDLASSDGVVAAAVWHLKIRGWMRLLTFVGLLKANVRVVDLATEFSDGTFFCTANNLGLDPSGEVPGVGRLQLPNEIPVEEMVISHRARVAAILAERAGTVPVLIRSEQELRQSEARHHMLKCAEKARNNYVDLQQFAGIVAQKPSQADFPEVREVAQELARIRKGVR